MQFQASTAMSMRSAFFLDCMGCRMVVFYRCIETTYWSRLQSSSSPRMAWPLKMRPIDCPETSVQNYRSTQHKIPKECRSLPSHIYCTSSSVQLTVFLFLQVNEFYEMDFSVTKYHNCQYCDNAKLQCFITQIKILIHIILYHIYVQDANDRVFWQNFLLYYH